MILYMIVELNHLRPEVQEIKFPYDRSYLWLLGWLLWVSLIKPASMSVRTYGCSHIRPSIQKKFLRFEWNMVLYVAGGRWVMHNGMPCGPIQGQGQGHMALKVRNSSISLSISNGSWQMTADS